MLQSVWSRLHRRRSILPARDVFDADLDRARQKPGCALCRLIQEHDQQAMHSFLWEYCTDPHVGVQISATWGYCPYHTWSLAVLEHERMGDGLGITIVYQALLKQLRRRLASQQQAKRENLDRELPPGPEIGATTCQFCRLARREESQFLARLVKRFQHVVMANDDGDWTSLLTEFCLPHTKCLLQACLEGLPRKASFWHIVHHGDRSTASNLPEQGKVHRLATLLATYRLNESSSPIQESPGDWGKVAQQLALLVGKREALPVLISSRARRSISRQLLLVTGQRSRLQSPSDRACPVCSMTAPACLESYKDTFETGKSLPSTMLFCQNHHWILAAHMLAEGRAVSIDRYRSWLKQQREQQQAALAHVHAYEDSRDAPDCVACTCMAEVSRGAIAAVIQSLRQTVDESDAAQEKLLCLFHWKQAHEECRGESDAHALQERLLHRQLRNLAQLDTAVEAYLARFNAGKRERGEVPNVPGASWAWERLLAFFAGEPALTYRPGD